MKYDLNSILALVEAGEFESALLKAESFCSGSMTSFMEELTVNTATDYVGAVLFYGQICSAAKKPWKVTKKLESAAGALRFLDDYMTDRETLSETYHAVALAFEKAGFLPEAAKYYRKEALSTEDRNSFVEALFLSLFFETRFGKKIFDDASDIRKLISENDLEKLEAQAKDESDSLMKLDPVESEESYLNCRYEVEEKVDRILAKEKRDDLPFCLRYWDVKKQVLSEDFGIVWSSPAEMNPEIRFM